MKKLHIVSILDRSGSMRGTESEVIGAYNSFIKEQKKLLKKKGVAGRVSLVLFDDQYDEVYTKTPISEVPTLTEDTYNVRGMTALYDAIGKTINKFEGKKNVIFFIETDGMENASKEFGASTLRAIIKHKEEEGWDFNFVGADLDAATTAGMGQAIGISAAKTMAFNKSAAGYAKRNAAFSASTMAYVDKSN